MRPVFAARQQGFIFRPVGDLYHLAVDYNAPTGVLESGCSVNGDSAPEMAQSFGRVALEKPGDPDPRCAGPIRNWRARNATAPGTSAVRDASWCADASRGGRLIGVIGDVAD